MSRVPNFPPKNPDELQEEIEQIINPSTPAARRARAQFKRDVLARIREEIERANPKAR